MNTSPSEPTEQQLSDAKECVVAMLAWHMSADRRPKVESVKQYAELHDKLHHNSSSEMVEAFKTEEGTRDRLARVNEVWEVGVKFLLSRWKRLSELERLTLMTGLQTLNMQRESLMGNMLLLNFPHMREKIDKMNQNASKL